MRFESFSAFLLMDGHGVYVWAAYVLTLVIVGVNLWWPGLVRKSFVKAEKRHISRDLKGKKT